MRQSAKGGRLEGNSGPQGQQVDVSKISFWNKIVKKN